LSIADCLAFTVYTACRNEKILVLVHPLDGPPGYNCPLSNAQHYAVVDGATPVNGDNLT
jgi:hypothetical protein